MNWDEIYGIIDTRCGAEHRFFIKESDVRSFFTKDIAKISTELFYHDIGNGIYLSKIPSASHAIYFLDLETECDLEDPSPSDIAEYYSCIDAEFATREVLEELDINLDTIHDRYDDRYDLLIKSGYPNSEFYNKEIMDADLRYSEIMKIFENGGNFDDVLAVARK